ncbi:glycosyltransferase [Halomonas sp. BM-2019]|uniref:glycosyltransferase family 2 protein n=1 Tax=Halomonas sp. BM-2019 TaxID=2811227 RepID=UPI001B3C4200|nr:MAG: glycosyltransferase [Halomonas sp. BM-2019]
MKPLVTVIIPVYNKEKYISRSIQSVLDQSYTQIELLIVDDAATDGSLARVAEFDDHRIRVIRRETPGPGGYAARNLGVENSSGEWVAFLDADDVWLPDHLERAVQMTREYPDIPIISAGRINQTGDKQEMDPFTQHFIDDGVKVLYLSDYLKFACKGMRAMQTNTLLLNRKALFSCKIFPEGRTDRSGDLYAWVQLLARMKVMVWSPHISAISYRDVIGVSRTSTPSIKLFRDMVDDLSPYVSREDVKWIKNFANHMVQYAWLEKKKKRVSLPFSVLPGSFYWSSDPSFCLKWTVISIMPFGFLEWVHNRYLAG